MGIDISFRPRDFSPFFPGCGSGSPTSTTRIHTTVRRVVSLLAPACGRMRTTFKEGEGEVHSPADQVLKLTDYHISRHVVSTFKSLTTTTTHCGLIIFH